jgi:hypothetical protein
MSNISIEDYVDSKSSKTTPELKEGKLKDMVTHVAREFPDWQFVGKSDHYSYDHHRDSTGTPIKTHTVSSFEVRNNNSVLGSIFINQWGNSPYVIDNERISLKRERGSGMKSADLNKVVKNMKKYFTELTLPEKLTKSFNKAEGALSDIIRTRGYEYRRAYEAVGNGVEDLLKEPSVYAKVRPLLIEMGLNEKGIQGLDNIPEYSQSYIDAKNLLSAYQHEFSERRASFVFIENSRYVFVRRDDRNNVVMREAEDIHPSVREALGLLKLMPEGAFLPNKGFKADDNVFIVFDDLPVKEKKDE